MTEERTREDSGKSMAEAHLTRERLREVLDYDPETGVFRWKRRMSSRAPAGGVAGSPHPKERYIIIGIDGRLYRAHRLAWLWCFGVWPSDEVDHWDVDRQNNRIANLRDCTVRINRQNLRRGHVDGSGGGLLGVSWRAHAKKWVATIYVDGRSRHLGYRDTPEEAHSLYVEAKRQLHAGCTL